MLKVLVTGARAPAALELIRQLAKTGITAYAADTVYFPISRPSKFLYKYYRVAPPATRCQQFISDLIKIVKQEKINFIIPTCEEIFYLSRYKSAFKEHQCTVYCDNLTKLNKLHHKHLFSNMVAHCHIHTPSSQLLTTPHDLTALDQPNKLVLKPAYSRFAAKTLIKPSSLQLENIHITPQRPWVAQTFISGKEYCSYSIANQGKLLAHACYAPQYRVGRGSGIYLQPYDKPKILSFIQNFIRHINFTGQIGFDFIEESDGRTYVLECNPRSTSGIHCLPSTIDWPAILTGQRQEMIFANLKSKMITSAMITFGLKNCCNKQFIKDLLTTKDIIYHPNDKMPSFYQFLSLSEILVKSIIQRKNPLRCATADIEWDGQAL